MFIEMPDNLVVPGLGEQPPTWNQLTVEYEDWYEIVLDFALKYLQDDGGILFILPIGSSVTWRRKFRASAWR
jgi:hypothetical protein